MQSSGKAAATLNLEPKTAALFSIETPETVPNVVLMLHEPAVQPP
ncbi:MAG: hypothetical protein DIU62_005870 [Pseudomonadota bacterium]